MLLRITVWILIAGLGACSGGDQRPVCELGESSVVLAVGDSLTRGYGAPERGYVEQLEERLRALPGLSGIQVVNEGIDGEQSGGLLARLPALLDEYTPPAVLITSGGNDVLRKVPPEQIADNLERIIRLVNASGALALLFSVPEPGVGALAGFLSDHPVFERFEERSGVVLLSGVVAETLADEALRSDRIHPNESGYARLSDAALDILGQCQLN